MHELGMLYHLAGKVTEIAKENNIEHVKTIAVEVGELTAVIPQIFEEYFPIVANEFPMVKGAAIHLTMVHGEAMCRDCHTLYNIIENKGECPNCHSTFKQILGGQGITLQNIGY